MFAERLLRAHSGPSAAVVYFLKAAITPACPPTVMVESNPSRSGDQTDRTGREHDRGNLHRSRVWVQITSCTPLRLEEADPE